MNAFVCCCCRQLSPPKHQLAGIAALLTSGVALLLFDLSACLALPVIVRKDWINKNKNVAHFVISNCTVSLSTAHREIWSCFRCGKRLPCVVVRVSIQRTLHRARGNVQQYDDYIIYSDICCKKRWFVYLSICPCERFNSCYCCRNCRRCRLRRRRSCGLRADDRF